MRRFYLSRVVDVSGVSGTGIVAKGVVFDDGFCVIRWLGATPSTVCWESIDHARHVHGHGGATEFIFIDDEEGHAYGRAAAADAAAA